MNAITSRRRNWSTPRTEITRTAERKQMMDVLLALDRMVVEVSMQLYQVHHHDRSSIRSNNRRLHAAVKKHLPRLMKRSRAE